VTIGTVYQTGQVTGWIQREVSDLHYPQSMAEVEPEIRTADEASRAFARAIREGREDFKWTQDDLAAAAGVSRPTINRYEQGKTRTPDPVTARAIFRALKLDPRRIPVLLGYVTAEEMDLPPEPPRVFERSVEDVIAILQDPSVDPGVKDEWVEYLRHRSAQGQSPNRRAG
jgi:transcriptional regulator with XRE-family HTH domain